MSTTPVPAAPPLLSPAEVERLEMTTRADLTGAVTHLAALRAGSAHLVAGFADWPDYLLERFGDLLAELKMVGDQSTERRSLVLRLRQGSQERPGMSQRVIAAKLGVGLGTVAEDIAQLRRDGLLGSEPRKIAGADGAHRPSRGSTRSRPVAAAPLLAPGGRVYEQAAEWLRRAEHGLTLVELARAAQWTEGKASGALSYLTAPARGFAMRVNDQRAGQRVHVLTDAGRDLLADRAADQPVAVPAVHLVREVAAG